MDALIIMLREGIEMVLVIGIMLAYLNKTGRTHLNRFVYMGLGAAAIFSLGAALVLKSLGIDPDNALVEGIIFLVASIFVTSMVVWMWKAGRHAKQQMENKLAAITSIDKSSAAQIVGVFGLSFFMIAREGIETVLFFSALSLTNSNQIMSLVGATAGLLLSIGFGILFVRGSLKINLHKFFGVTSVVLMLLVLKFLAGAVHEFSEIGLLHISESAENAVSFIAENNISTWLLVILLAFPVLTNIIKSIKERLYKSRYQAS